MKKAVRSPKSPREAPEALNVVVRALDAKKAEDLLVLDVRAHSSITNYLVLATGSSGPHLRALRNELEKALGEARVSVVGVESTEGSGWVVFDAFDVMVHLFTAGTRAKYGLELLWKDAVTVSLNNFLSSPTARHTPRRFPATGILGRQRKRDAAPGPGES